MPVHRHIYLLFMNAYEINYIFKLAHTLLFIFGCYDLLEKCMHMYFLFFREIDFKHDMKYRHICFVLIREMCSSRFSWILY